MALAHVGSWGLMPGHAEPCRAGEDAALHLSECDQPLRFEHPQGGQGMPHGVTVAGAGAQRVGNGRPVIHRLVSRRVHRLQPVGAAPGGVYWWSRCSDRSRKDRGPDGL